MATPSFNRKANTIKGYTSGVIAWSELDTSNAPTTWQQFEFANDLTIEQTVEEIEERDDSNKVIAFDESINGVTVSGKIMSRDEKVRQLFQETGTQSVKGKTYAVAIAGNSDLNGKKEVWAFYAMRFSRAFQYGAGTNDAKYSYKLVALPNQTGATASWALPTGAFWTGNSATGTASIANGEYYYTADL